MGSSIYLGCNWLTTIFVVLLYPTYEASGCLAAAMAVGNVVASIVLFKVRAFQVSDIRNDFQSSDYISLRIICAFSGIAFGIAYSLLTVSRSALEASIAYSILKMLDSTVDVFHGIDQRHDRLDIAGVSQSLRGALQLACFIFVSITTGNLTLAILAMAISSLIVMALFDLPTTNKLEKISIKFEPKKLTTLAISCLPGFAALTLSTLVVSLSRQLFGLEYGDEALGIYAAVATPAVIIQAMASYVYAPLLGPIAISYSQKRTKEILRILLKFCIALSLITVASLLVSAVAAEPLFNLVYGPTIVPYVYLIYPVVLCTSFTAAELFMLDMLIVFRCYKGAIATCLLSFALSIVLIGPLSSIFGMNGISFTVLIAYLGSILLSVPFFRRALKQ